MDIFLNPNVHATHDDNIQYDNDSISIRYQQQEISQTKNYIQHDQDSISHNNFTSFYIW